MNDDDSRNTAPYGRAAEAIAMFLDCMLARSFCAQRTFPAYSSGKVARLLPTHRAMSFTWSWGSFGRHQPASPPPSAKLGLPPLGEGVRGFTFETLPAE